jgi:hypothetical protein
MNKIKEQKLTAYEQEIEDNLEKVVKYSPEKTKELMEMVRQAAREHRKSKQPPRSKSIFSPSDSLLHPGKGK